MAQTPRYVILKFGMKAEKNASALNKEWKHWICPIAESLQRQLGQEAET